jgi:uncharacterized protein
VRVAHRFTVFPFIDLDNEAFWTSGREGDLKITACNNCGRYMHPPAPVCRFCASRDVAPRAVSGRGSLYSYSINSQDWGAGADDEFVYALVELEEQPGLRLTSHLVGCPMVEVRIGLPVQVDFIQADRVWFPVFRPVL